MNRSISTTGLSEALMRAKIARERHSATHDLLLAYLVGSEWFAGLDRAEDLD